WWRSIGSPTRVLAPMVNQSELAFRLLARRHGAQLCYTPMLHAANFASDEVYRQDNFDPHPSDRPLVVQFCGDVPATLLAAARHVEARCDAVEINCGCPQGIARRGHYGAFLLDEPDLIVSMVSLLASQLSVPVLVKMRTAAEAAAYKRTVELGLALQAAGCALLTLHGRTKEQRSMPCDWRAIRALKRALSIPVVANGGVEAPEDVAACLSATEADGVMSSEAASDNPAI
ncbi:hypothetical protein EMIHUDRAFT_43539, partial [Emiliania huxleyi CCMP1516]